MTRDILLIHGAWAGSWAWGRLVPELEALGWRVTAVDLPGNGTDDTAPADVSLDLYVAHAGRALAATGGAAVVVGHSGGGIVASQLAEAMPERVARLVYVAGIMLPSGGTFLDVIRTLLPSIPAADGIAPHLIWSEDRLTSRVSEAGARAVFFNDCTRKDAAWAAARLTPQPERGRAVSPILTGARFGSIPRVYIEASQDRSVIPEAQALMQKLTPGARRVVIDAGHVPQLSRPPELAALIDEACATG